jgi:hypothetical protein
VAVELVITTTNGSIKVWPIELFADEGKRPRWL